MTVAGETEPVVTTAMQLTRIEPVTFNGIDCGVLAERYVAYRRDRGLDAAQQTRMPETAAPSEQE